MRRGTSPPAASGGGPRSARRRHHWPVGRTAALLLALPAVVLTAAGCSQVQQAVESANAAIDGAQSVLDAPARIGAACESALDALTAGRPPDQAREAIDRALAELDRALGAAGSLPGLAELSDALAAAAESLAGDAARGEAARSAVRSACAPFTS